MRHNFRDDWRANLEIIAHGSHEDKLTLFVKFMEEVVAGETLNWGERRSLQTLTQYVLDNALKRTAGEVF